MEWQDGLANLLLRNNIVSPDQLINALLGQAASKYVENICTSLIKMGIVEESVLYRFLSEQISKGELAEREERDIIHLFLSCYNVELAKLKGKKISRQVIRLVPRNIAVEHIIMPLECKEQTLTLVMANLISDSAETVLQELKSRTGCRLKILVAPVSVLRAEIKKRYPTNKSLLRESRWLKKRLKWIKEELRQLEN